MYQSKSMNRKIDGVKKLRPTVGAVPCACPKYGKRTTTRVVKERLITDEDMERGISGEELKRRMHKRIDKIFNSIEEDQPSELVEKEQLITDYDLVKGISGEELLLVVKKDIQEIYRRKK